MGTRGLASVASRAVAACVAALLLAACGDAGEGSAGPAGGTSAAPTVAPAADRPEDLGCTPDGAPYPIGPWTADSQQGALTAMVDDAFPAAETYEVGFLAGADGTLGPQFVLRTDWRGASMTGSVGAAGGTWTARLDQSCAERLAPPYDPLDGWTETTDEVHFTCTPDGTTADRSIVVAAHDGVRVEVDDRTGWEATALQVGPAERGSPLGGPRVTDSVKTPLQLAPGRWLVGCSPEHMTPAAAPARITVRAGPEVWRPPLDRLRCGHGGTPDFFDGLPTGRTEQEALGAALGVLSAEAADSTVRLYDDGYWRTPGHGFVVLRPGADSVFWGRTQLTRAGRWQATFTELTCPPA